MKLKFLKLLMVVMLCGQPHVALPFFSSIKLPFTSQFSLPNPFAVVKELGKSCFSYLWNHYRPITRTELKRATQEMTTDIETKASQTDGRARTIITETMDPLADRLDATHAEVTALSEKAEAICQKGQEAEEAVISLSDKAALLAGDITTLREEDTEDRKKFDESIAQLGVSIALIKPKVIQLKEVRDRLPASRRNIRKIREGLEKASDGQDAEIDKMEKITKIMAAVSKSTAFSVEQRIKQLDELDTSSLTISKKNALQDELNQVQHEKLRSDAHSLHFHLYSALEQKLLFVMGKDSDVAPEVLRGSSKFSFKRKSNFESIGLKMIRCGLAAALPIDSK